MNEQPVVLYVEDDAQSRKVMQMMLAGRMRLPHVTILEDSTDFLTRVQQLEPVPTIIFLDIHVKPYSGFEMLTMLRQLEHFKKTPVIALTASVMNEEVVALRAAGFNGCIAKPIDLSTFPDTLYSITDGERIWRVLG